MPFSMLVNEPCTLFEILRFLVKYFFKQSHKCRFILLLKMLEYEMANDLYDDSNYEISANRCGIILPRERI